MAGEHGPGAADVVVYVDHSVIDMDRLDDLKAGIRSTVATLEKIEPRLLAYGFYVDEDAGRMSVTAVHPDSASLELHLEVGNELFRALGPMLTLESVEVYGSITEAARAMLERKMAMLGGQTLTVVERFEGFARI